MGKLDTASVSHKIFPPGPHSDATPVPCFSSALKSAYELATVYRGYRFHAPCPNAPALSAPAGADSKHHPAFISNTLSHRMMKAVRGSRVPPHLFTHVTAEKLSPLMRYRLVVHSGSIATRHHHHERAVSTMVNSSSELMDNLMCFSHGPGLLWGAVSRYYRVVVSRLYTRPGLPPCRNASSCIRFNPLHKSRFPTSNLSPVRRL